MHRTKKNNTAINNFFNDVFNSILKKEIVGNLKKTDFIIYRDLCIENDEYHLLECSKSRERKSLKLFFSTWVNPTVGYESYDHFIEIFENGEFRFYKDEDSEEYEIISMQEDIFNIAIQYEMYMSMEELQLLKRLFKKVVKKRDLTTLRFYYGKGEEKMYGY